MLKFNLVVYLLTNVILFLLMESKIIFNAIILVFLSLDISVFPLNSRLWLDLVLDKSSLSCHISVS